MSNKIFITGVSRGLGYALAETFYNRDYSVYGVSRSNPDNSLLDKINFFSIDLEFCTKIKGILEEKESELKDTDILILNAAILPPLNDMKDTEYSMLKKTFAVNLFANKEIIDFFLNKSSVKQVVAISSGASLSGNRGWNGYSLSKCSLNMLIKLYSQESLKVHFISLAPGLVDSAMQSYIQQYSAKHFAVVDRLKYAKKEGLVISPFEIAGKIADNMAYFKTLPSGSYFDIRNKKDAE